MAPVVIKKYGNRRLYDTGDSRYVTLDELATKVRTGLDVRVLDAQTNDDLTQATLTQIVLETGRAAKLLPVQLLLQMIRMSDASLAEFFRRNVTRALELYLKAKRGGQTRSSYNPPTHVPVAARQLHDNGHGPQDRNSDVAEIRRELDELKQAIRDAKPDNSAKKKKS